MTSNEVHITVLFLVYIQQIGMKDFDNGTAKEKEEVLKQVQNLPEDSRDSLDLFTQSFNEFSQNWSNDLKEFDTMYPDFHKESHIKSIKREGKEDNK